MSNLKMLFLILLICLSFCACDTLHVVTPNNIDPDTQEFSYRDNSDTWLHTQSSNAKASKLVGYGDYLYYKDSKSLAKYNVKTGVKTYLCGDPICSHKTKECPLYGYTDFGAVPLFYGDKLYYFVDYDEGVYINGIFDHVKYVNNLSCYDISNQKHQIILDDFLVNIVEYIVFENRFYYYQPYQDEQGNYIYYLNYVNLDTGAVTEKLLLADLDGRQPNNIVTAYNGQLYFASYLYGELYSYDISNFSTKTMLYKAPDGYNIAHISCEGESFYFVIQNSDKSEQKLCRFDSAKNETTVLYSFASPLSYVYYTHSYAYYTYDEKKTIGTTADTKENIILPDSKIYRISLSDKSPTEEFIFEFTDSMSMFSIRNFVVCGNYIYAFYISWMPSGDTLVSTDGYSSIDDRVIMRIDIETGEIYYIK